MNEPAHAHSALLSGCRTAPLGSYLKALGVLRLVAEQADPNARGHWDNDRFVLTSQLSEGELQQFFQERYSPTPIVSPWNGGSGFYFREVLGQKDPKTGKKETSGQRNQPTTATRTVEAVRAGRAERLREVRRIIEYSKEIIDSFGLLKAPSDDSQLKHALLERLRGTIPDVGLAWLDAAVLITESRFSPPPLLGVGGNDGNLDFSTNLLQNVVEVFDPDTGEPRAGSSESLQAALFSVATPSLSRAPIGQFVPGAAGGPNAGTGFEAHALINRWEYILMLEGTLLFAATATRRHAQYGKGQLSYPFTVHPTGAGTGAANVADEAAARKEFWAPIWEQPMGLLELRALLGEGRATVGGRAARDGLDFARAVAALGIERGVTAFQRYSFMQRSGRSYLATPLNRVPVRRNRSADLVDQLDSNQFLRRFRSFARSSTNRAARLRRVLDDRLFALIDPGEPNERDRPQRVQALLDALGPIGRYLAVNEKARKDCPRLPWLDARWVLDADDRSPEVRLAAAFAGLGDRDLPFLCHLLPVNAGDPTRYDTGSRLVTWHHGDLVENLVDAFRRRLLEARRREELPSKPLRGQPPVGAPDLSAFLEGHTDDARIARLLPGLALVRQPPETLAKTATPAPLPAAYRAMKPLFAPDDHLRRVGLLAGDAMLPLPERIPALLAADRCAEAWELSRRRMQASGVPIAFRDLDMGLVAGPRLLAALMLPVGDRTLREIAYRIRPPERAEEARRDDSAA